MARIVIVDDSTASRTLLKTLLVDAGHEVVAEAENGQDAILACQSYQPDIVTLDIGMPTLDGISALKVIRSNFPAIKPVMISASSEKSKIYTALELGAVYYIIKPFDVKFVSAAINDVLSGSFAALNKKRQHSASQGAPFRLTNSY